MYETISSTISSAILAKVTGFFPCFDNTPFFVHNLLEEVMHKTDTRNRKRPKMKLFQSDVIASFMENEKGLKPAFKQALSSRKSQRFGCK